MKQDSFFTKTIAELKEKGLYNDIKVIESGQGAYLSINGQKKLNLCSNNYLGLASDERLKTAAIEAIQKYGVGTGAVRALSGTNVLHLELEKKLAQFKKAEAALVVQGGYMANLVAIQTIIGKEDIVISDEFNHASIIDAIRLSQVQNKFVYKHSLLFANAKSKHNDGLSLEECLVQAKQLQQASKSEQTPRILVVTDGVFSMDGDIAKLPEIAKLAKEYEVMTMVDDAHGEGVLGGHGRGIVDHFNLHGQIDIEVGTLSKAFGVIGGFISGQTDLIEYYRQKARQFLFSTGLSIPDTAALVEAVNILQQSDELVIKLWDNAKYLKQELVKLGFDCGQSETPITPVMLGDENLAKNFSKQLFEKGVYATPIKFPMVALGKARIRLMPSAAHSKEDLDKGISAFQKVGQKLGVLN